LDESKEITDIQGFPSVDSPVSSFEDKDEAYTIIAKKIAATVKELTNYDDTDYEERVSSFKKNHINESIQEITQKKKIYLSVGSNQEERNGIFSELSFRKQWKKWPYTIIPNPDEAKEMENLRGEELSQAIQKHLNDSLFSIHLLGDNETASSEIVRTQYMLARDKCSSSSFRCVLAINDAEAENVLLKNSDEDHTTNPSIEKISNWNKEVIIQKIDRLNKEGEERVEALKRAEDKIIRGNETVFLLYDSVDENNAIRDQLKKELEDKNIDVSPNIFDKYIEDSINIRQHEEEQIRASDGVIIFYAAANDDWCKTRQHYVLKQKIQNRGVCVDEPNIPTKVSRNVRKNKFLLINETKGLKKDVTEFVSRLRSD
jgi:hypothetical protein